MGSGPRPGGRVDPERDRRPEVEDAKIGVAILGNAPGLGARLRAEGAGWGSFILSAERVVSTNELALRFARGGAPHGSLFLAEEQTGGRGRWNRRWESRRGGLYLSVVLRPSAEFHPTLLPLLVAVAGAEALISVSRPDIRVRWPNDLYLDGRKLGGILCEGSFKGSRPEIVVAGVGVNVNQPDDDFTEEVARRAISLRAWSLEELDVAAKIVAHLERWWEAWDEARILERWRELAEGAWQSKVEVQPRNGAGFAAVTQGIAEDGGLVVDLEDGTRKILYAEDVLYVR